MKKNKLILAFSCLVLSACSTYSKSESTDPHNINIGILPSISGLGDRSFNDAAFSGVLRAATEYDIHFNFIQPESDDRVLPKLTEMAKSHEYDLIFVMSGGDAHVDAIIDVNTHFPEQRISHIDSLLDLPNVSALQTKWQEQTFFTGIIAGLGTISDMPLVNPIHNKIGMIIGEDVMIMRQGLLGYMAGAYLVNPDVDIVYEFSDTYRDQAITYLMASQMFDSGIDFILTITGGAAPGVYSAAHSHNRYAFATGASQNFIEPYHIIATGYRSVSDLVFNEIEALIEGRWADGLHLSGIVEGTVGLDTFQSNVVIPDHIQAAIDLSYDMIMTGELVVPATFDELDDWVLANGPYFEHFRDPLQQHPLPEAPVEGD